MKEKVIHYHKSLKDPKRKIFIVFDFSKTKEIIITHSSGFSFPIKKSTDSPKKPPRKKYI